MPPESHRPTTTTKPHLTAACATGAPPPEPEHLPCPRCDSTNTKFCYYNNYNFSQPRHFCKSCRRYWTHGGTLRDIPVGGGSRKNAKRSRLTTATTTPNTEFRHMPPPSAAPILFPFAGDHVSPAVSSFTSLLNGNQSHGLFGIGFEDATFGFGRSIWPFSTAGDGGHYGGGSTGGGGGLWQVDGGDGGGECFTLPELAISTPGMM